MHPPTYCLTGVNQKQETKPGTHSQCCVQQKGTVGERTRKGCRLEYLAAIWLEQGDDQSEPESRKWESVSHSTFTTVPPPGLETKPVEPVGRHRDQNTCKLRLVFERRKKKKQKNKKPGREESPADWTQVRSYKLGKIFFERRFWYISECHTENALLLHSLLCSH